MLYFLANFSREVVNNLPVDIATGVYYGWAQVDKSPIYKMVMSIGWNPFYNNKEKSMVSTSKFYTVYIFYFFYLPHIEK